MFKKFYSFLFYTLFIFLIYQNNVVAKIINKIEVKGNERISKETIIMFSNVSPNENIDSFKLNSILKNLYNSNFFENISVNLVDNILIITVKELPIIENITFEGIKAKKIKTEITKNLKLKQRASFDEILLKEDKKKIFTTLRNLGYYFPKIETYLEDSGENRVNIVYKINLGEKAKIKKISFVGDKIYKDRKL